MSAGAEEGNKECEDAKKEKAGLTCAVTVELDGKAPGLPTGATLNPSHARQQHSCRSIHANSITPGSEVKLDEMDLAFSGCRSG